MKLMDTVTEMALKMANGYTGSMEKEDPKKFDQLERFFNSMVEVAIHMLEESPEFRKQFARIHAAFLQYPECKMVIEEATHALEEFGPGDTVH